jgi:hypothetical protein
MKTLSGAAAAAAIALSLSVSLGAQWPSYPTPDVPRTPDGKPILDGPAPRTPDGKVDFSGIWGLGGFGGGGAGGGGGRGRGAAPAPVRPRRPLLLLIPTRSRGHSSSRSRAGEPRCRYSLGRGAQEKRMADNSKDNPDVWCLPIG